LYAVRKGASSNWSGDRTQSTVWTIPNLNPFSGGHDADNPVTGHSTQKPVALYERALINNSAPGDSVMDMFAGSGTMVIAAEKTGRRSIAIELDPRYVQVTLDRWAAYTHGTVRKVSTCAAEASR
jgi:DNA modification methylase